MYVLNWFNVRDRARIHWIFSQNNKPLFIVNLKRVDCRLSLHLFVLSRNYCEEDFDFKTMFVCNFDIFCLCIHFLSLYHAAIFRS
jgi:hypothetical protein